MIQLPNINILIEINRRLILSSKRFFLVKKLKSNDNIKKKEAIKGAENKKNMPILKVENPIILKLNFL